MTPIKLLAGLSTTAPAFAPGAAMAQPADFTARADAIVNAAYPADGPGAAVVVSRGGQIIYAAGRGLADLNTRRPITPETVFRMGSIAKQFTAAVILQLVDEGRLSLDDPIGRFFPDFPQPTANATVRQLLNHTSGIQDYSKIPGWIAGRGTRPVTTAELVAEVRSRPPRTAPGQAWEYNNAGYMMLGAIIERVTGRPWYQAVAERITRPLGLRTIAYGGAGDPSPATARGYSVENGDVEPAVAAHMSVAHAAGGLVGSALDLAQWADALHHGRVVSPPLYQEMIRPARLADGSSRPYGFGLRLQRLLGHPALAHGGAGRGLDADSIYIPSADLFVAVLSNSDEPATDPSRVSRRLAALAMGEPFPVLARAEIDPAILAPLFGLYRTDREPLRFFARAGKLYLADSDDEMEVLPAGEDRFFLAANDMTWFRVLREPDGAHVMELHAPEAAPGAPERAVRSGPVPAPLAVAAAVLQSYVGTYQTETVAVTIALAGDGGLTISPAGQQPVPMHPISETEFRIEGGSMRLVFHPESGVVNRLTIHRGARELHGRRIGQ